MMFRHETMRAAALALALAAGLPAASAAAQDVLFSSTQARPAEEAQALRDQVLAGAGVNVDYQPQEPGPFLTRVQAELEAGTGSIGVLGGVHGDFTTLGEGLVDLKDIVPADAGVNKAFMNLGTLGTGEQKYLPWMQASYIMAANKKALEHLPEGADVNALTYDQLIEWGRRMAEATGSPKIGLPVGPKGLKHRLIQGYLYPSFTDSMVTKFRSPEAEAMWNKVKELWSVTNPASTGYAFMQEPLLSEEVWVAWDHTARLAEAFKQRPDDFVAFPAPAGPGGRGFMPVVAGLAIPKTAPDIEASKRLIQHLMQPETQVATLRAVNFFPVVDAELPVDMPASVKAASAAIEAQAGAPDANPALLPIGLGSQDGKFNQVYTDTFERIVLGNEDVRQVLDTQAEALKGIIAAANAPCWAPDEPSHGPCPVE